MSEQVQKRHATTKEQQDQAADTTLEDAAAAAELAQAEAAAVTDLTDDILADIDAALQGLDQDLAANFKQQGGQ